jgi:hypothetical protein
MAVELFRCGKCRRSLPREGFYRNVTTPNDISAFCRECCRTTGKARRLANKAANLAKRQSA